MRRMRQGPTLGTSLIVCAASVVAGALLGRHPDLLRPPRAAASAARAANDAAPGGPEPLPLFAGQAPDREEGPHRTRHPDPVLSMPAGSAPVGSAPAESPGSMPSGPDVDADPDPELDPRHDGLGRAFGEGMLVTGATPHRLILFTFDDGPDLRHTPDLLDTLDELGIRALFFLTAERIEPRSPWGREHAVLAREIARRGHLVGNHTVDHAQLPLLTDVEVVAQLDESERIFEEVFGGRPWLFRPPGGARSARVDALLAERGYTTMLWNLGTGDFQVRTAEAVFSTWRKVFERRRLENGDQGGIVLLHDTHEWSVGAVPLIVEHLRRENCRLLAEGEELYDIVDDPRFFFVPHGGTPVRADAPPAMPSPDVLAQRQGRLRQEASQRCGG